MERSSFFNSINGDRKYKAEDFARYFGSFISNGIFPNPGNNLQVVSNNDMTVTLKPGKAWINGYYYENTDDLILPIDVADGVLDRIDRVVVRLDYVNRDIKTVVKKGTFASNPTAPTLQRDMDIYELGIADIKINKGAISILQADITDTRLDLNLCGVTNSLITVDVGIITEQFSEDFTSWFERIKGQLGEDPAGNLQNQIDLLEENKVSNVTFDEHLADYESHINQVAGENLGHIYKSDLNGVWTLIDKIEIINTIHQLDIDIPQDYRELKIIIPQTLVTGSKNLLFKNDKSTPYYKPFNYIAITGDSISRLSDQEEINLGEPRSTSCVYVEVAFLENNIFVIEGKLITPYSTTGVIKQVIGYSNAYGAEKISFVHSFTSGTTFEIWGR